MKKLLLILLMAGSAWGTTFEEKYCRSGGDNLNSGSTTNVAAINTYAGGTFVRATGVFTPASGDPVADGVTNGAWASIYTTAGATVATCVGLVTNVSTTTITISQVALAGAVANVSEAAAASTCKIGGAWKGPNAAVSFPFGFATAQMTNNPTIYPRVNFMADATYVISAAMTHSLNGPIRFQGYTATPGDLGKATIDDTTAGAGIVLLTVSGGNVDLLDFIFANTGATSSTPAAGINLSGASCTFSRVVIHDVRATGIAVGSVSILVECEAYTCNKANAAQTAGFSLTSGARALRCISHDNSTANGAGFVLGSSSVAVGCIADSNGTNGFLLNSGSCLIMQGCDAYNNGGHGAEIFLATAGAYSIENCNFVKNGGWGITSSATLRNGRIVNCGFGAGTEANALGNINGTGAINETGTVNYANNVTPWVDPANGDFRITLTAAKSAGRGAFTQTASSYAGTVAYPDIGAAQATDTNSVSSATVGYGFAQ